MANSTTIVNASFTLTLGKEASGKHFSAEIDARALEDGGINARDLGKTSDFEPGDAIAFLVYMEDGMKLISARHTLESISGASLYQAGTSQVKQIETLKFDGSTRQSNLAKPTKEFFSKQWIGNNLETIFGGVLSIKDGLQAELPSAFANPYNDTNITNKNTTPGSCNVIYYSTAYVGKFSTPTKAQMLAYGKPPYNVEIYLKADLA